MTIERVKTGVLEENCYILKDEATKECLVVDPGADFELIKEKIGKFKVLKVLITHGHFDHVGALQEVENEYKVMSIKKSSLEEKEYSIGNFKFTVIFTPGHTSDSITYYFFNEKVMFTGDFLFKGTVGRVDLPTGDSKMLFNSIKKIKNYPEDTKIYPGHGEVSTLGDEFKNNQYFII